MVTDNHTQKRRSFLAQLGTAGTVALMGTTTHSIEVLAWGKDPSLDKLTADDFLGLVGQVFNLRLPEEALSTAATLVDVSVLERTGDVPGKLQRQRDPFSIVFSVPTWFECAQASYILEHPSLGAIQLLMTPVDLPQYGRLEAVFG